jgi:hypothetical protein
LGVGICRVFAGVLNMTDKKITKRVVKVDNSKLNRELIAVTLHEQMISFIKEFNIIDEKYQLPEELNELLSNHLSIVMGIIRQHMIINNVTKTGRPKNDIAREYFRNEVVLHQMRTKSTKEFPKESDFFNQLTKVNDDLFRSGQKEITIDTRTFNNFKKEWKEGTF